MIVFQMMRDIHSHLNEEAVEEYTAGICPEEAAARYEEHLLACELCRSKVQETEAYLVAMQSAAKELRRKETAAKPQRTSSVRA
jgi:ribosomal protein L37AE/L43A